VLEFLVLFSVILLGPIVVTRFGMPGLIGLVLGGFAVGSHGLDLISSGNHTVPELGHLGLLYLMFVAGLELDLHVLGAYRRAAVVFGLTAFVVPLAAGIGVGWGLGWSAPAAILLGAMLSSHTLIVYPTLREAGLSGHPAVAVAVGATVLTDTLALIVLAVISGTQTGSGSVASIVAEIAIGLVVLLAVAGFLLPRLADLALRRWGGDRVARYLVLIVGLLLMAALAEVFDIEGIVGAFFAGLALNRLVPNEGPSMERIEFFGAAVFIPVFLVSIGLLLDPSVMFTGETLGIAALLCVAALGGKAIACWLAGPMFGFSRVERVAMYVLTIPQAAATLAVTLIGFEIGLFGTTVVNAVLVLILVSILTAALLAQRVIQWVPARVEGRGALGKHVLVVTPAGGPSDAAARLAARLARLDGGRSDLVIAGADGPLDAKALRAVERRIVRHGFDGHVGTGVEVLPDTVTRALLDTAPSLVIVDDPGFDVPPGRVPVLVVDAAAPEAESVRVIVAEDDGLAEEIAQRLAPRRPRPIPFGRDARGSA
jgi:Kef-type K+ transport system membrane component KefB